MRNRNQLKAGFTVLELLVVIAVSSLVMLIAAPSFHRARLVAQLDAVTSGVVNLMERASSEAGRRGVPVVIVPTLAGDESELLMFADYYDAEAGQSGSDLIFTPDGGDRSLLRWRPRSSGKTPVRFWNPIDDGPEGENAIAGFSSNPEGEDLSPIIVFFGDMIDEPGSMSFALSDFDGESILLCQTVEVSMLSGSASLGRCPEGV